MCCIKYHNNVSQCFLCVILAIALTLCCFLAVDSCSCYLLCNTTRRTTGRDGRTSGPSYHYTVCTLRTKEGLNWYANPHLVYQFFQDACRLPRQRACPGFLLFCWVHMCSLQLTTRPLPLHDLNLSHRFIGKSRLMQNNSFDFYHPVLKPGIHYPVA